MRLTELGGQMRMATTNPTMNPAGNNADIRSIQSMPQDGPAEATFGHMKWIPLALGLTAALATGCSKTTVRSTQLAQGAALLAIEPVKAHVVVDTTTTLQAVSQTKVVLGIFRSGDREFAEYPGMIFQRGPGTRERKAAIHKALKGTDFDVLVNPKYIVQERHRPFARTVTVQVAGFGGHLVFENPELSDK